MIDDGDLRIGVIDIFAWEAAVESWSPGGVPSSADAGDLMLWHASGLLLDDGTVDPSWAEAIEIARDPRVAMSIVAVHGDTAFVTNAFASDALVLVTTRCHVVDSRVVEADPATRVTLVGREAAGGALRRVLPPSEPFHAAPTTAAEPREAPDVAGASATDPAGIVSLLSKVSGSGSAVYAAQVRPGARTLWWLEADGGLTLLEHPPGSVQTASAAPAAHLSDLLFG